jgi:glyoxylase-like metal-dependent hydrolase (beta-lactamase superfamily II)
MTSFALDDYRCRYLNVGSFEANADTLFGDAPPDELAEALERHELDPEQIVFQVRSLVVDSGANRVLIDPSGAWEDPHRLGLVLEQEGIDPGSIDTVIVSHGHADHFWGGVRADGRPLFTNARYYIQRSEWQHWLAAENPEPDHAENFQRTLLPLEDRFTLVDGECEIVPGIRCRPTPGHSPGHMAVQIGEKAIYTGDVLISPVNVEHPDWTARFDVWPEQVVASRRRLLRELGQSGSLVLTCHLPGSGAGRVVAAGEGWRWQPEDLEGLG